MPKRGYGDVLDPTKKQRVVEEKIGRTEEKLGESERRSLGLQVAQQEEDLRAQLDLNKDSDVSELKRQIDHKKMILQRDDDLTPKSANASNRLSSRAKEIEAILKSKMPTKREMWPKIGSPEAQQAVRHNLSFQSNYDGLCREWQDIQRKLNPDDPYAQSLELIRPD